MSFRGVMKMGYKLWAVWFNKNGLWWKTPKRVEWDDNLEAYLYKNGDADLEKEGFYIREGGYGYFASESKKEVETFINGFRACASMLSDLNRSAYNDLKYDGEFK